MTYQTSTQAEAAAARLEKRARVRRQWAERLIEEADEMNIRAMEIGLIAGDLADRELDEKYGDAA